MELTRHFRKLIPRLIPMETSGDRSLDLAWLLDLNEYSNKEGRKRTLKGVYITSCVAYSLM